MTRPAGEAPCFRVVPDESLTTPLQPHCHQHAAAGLALNVNETVPCPPLLHRAGGVGSSGSGAAPEVNWEAELAAAEAHERQQDAGAAGLAAGGSSQIDVDEGGWLPQ